MLAEKNTKLAFKCADYGHILESDRVMMEGAAQASADTAEDKEF